MHKLTTHELFSINLDQLNQEALRVAKAHVEVESYLFQVIEVVEERGLHEDCELSLFKYCSRLLGLSESISYCLISVIRKGREVPEFREAVLSGELSLSKAKKICSVITSDNHKVWIDLARYETSRVIEKCVASANPKELIKESLTYKSADRLELKVGISEEIAELLKAAKDFLSQKTAKAVSTEEALELVLKEYVVRHDPVEKALRAKVREEKRETKRELKREENQDELASQKSVDQQFPGTVKKVATHSKTKHKRMPIKRITIHAVSLRDQNQCTHVSQFGRCEQKRWLDIHHVTPIGAGGTNAVDNLTTLCSAHHRMIHR